MKRKGWIVIGGVITVIAFGFLFVQVFGLASANGEKEAAREAEYRKKVDKIFFELEETIGEKSKESTSADTADEEYIAIMGMSEAISNSLSELRKMDSPKAYKEQHQNIHDRLFNAYGKAVDSLHLYKEGKHEKGYESIQDIIDAFADAYKYKNEVFGYK